VGLLMGVTRSGEDLLEPLKPVRAMVSFRHSTHIMGSSRSHTIRENVLETQDTR